MKILLKVSTIFALVLFLSGCSATEAGNDGGETQVAIFEMVDEDQTSVRHEIEYVGNEIIKYTYIETERYDMLGMTKEELEELFTGDSIEGIEMSVEFFDETYKSTTAIDYSKMDEDFINASELDYKEVSERLISEGYTHVQ